MLVIPILEVRARRALDRLARLRPRRGGRRLDHGIRCTPHAPSSTTLRSAICTAGEQPAAPPAPWGWLRRVLSCPLVVKASCVAAAAWRREWKPSVAARPAVRVVLASTPA
eukprot:1222841-Prymnesium_polylepis.6